MHKIRFCMCIVKILFCVLTILLSFGDFSLFSWRAGLSLDLVAVFIFILLQSNEKYRCSETGYRIPLKCVEIKDSTKNGNENKSQNSRSSIELSNENANAQESSHGTVSNKPRGLLDDSSTLEDGSQVYITYRSCITPVNEEKLSVVGFEVC